MANVPLRVIKVSLDSPGLVLYQPLNYERIIPPEITFSLFSSQTPPWFRGCAITWMKVSGLQEVTFSHASVLPRTCNEKFEPEGRWKVVAEPL